MFFRSASPPPPARLHKFKSHDDASTPLLFFSTRQGRQSNCVGTVEAARFVAEKLSRRLVLPPCHTSPLGEQACAFRKDLPPQRQTVVPFSLQRVLQPRDLARCRAPPTATLLTPSDLPVTAEPRNVTCIEVRSVASTYNKDSNPCAHELAGDDELRSALPIRFVRHLTISTSALLASSPSAPLTRAFDTLTRTQVPLPPGDYYIREAFMLFSRGTLLANSKKEKLFGLCALPRETEAVARMERHLQRSLGFSKSSTLCLHWRGEDFHHPNTLRKHNQDGTTAFAAAQTIKRAKDLGASSVLVLSNARFEALHELLELIRKAGLSAQCPRNLDGTTFGCATSYVYGTVAEMLACSKARHFLGSPRSSFSSHIEAMRTQRGINGTIAYLADRP